MRSQHSPADPFFPTKPKPVLGRIAAFVAASAISAAILIATSPAAARAQAFGGSVLVTDGYILVGESAHEREPGTVWVFARDGDSWRSVAALRATPGTNPGLQNVQPRTLDRFGHRLAQVGDHVFVTAGAQGGGQLYSFRLEDIGDPDARPDLQVAVSNGPFGTMLAGWEDELVISYPRSDGYRIDRIRMNADGAASPAGQFTVPLQSAGMGTIPLAHDDQLLAFGDPFNNAVHIFERPAADGAWESAGTLTAPGEPAQPTSFGFSLALGGGELLVGELQTQVVHRYARVDGTWQSVGTLEPEDDVMRLGYGTSLAADGETLLVGGARQFHEYRRSGEGWARTGDSPLYNADGAPASRGAGLHIGDQVAVLADPSADFGLGAATVFSRESGEWARSERLVAGHEPLPAISGGEITCEDGEAAGYDCDEVDLLAFVPWEALGGARGARLNDVWGWTDPETGREYAIVCLMDGTSFVDVTDPSNPRFLGNLPMTEGSRANTWRDAKVFNNHAFIVADGAGAHGMQVFDLTRLRNVTEPEVFEADALYTGITSSHNVAINEVTGFAYLVGSSGEESCGGGSHMVDINDPLNPVFAGCFAHPNTGRRGTGNSHDAHCVIYHGPDEEYQGREICVNSNETALSVADVTDKDNPVAVSSAAYPNVAYAHQGWLTDDHRYFYSNDELDEVNGLVEATRTLVWDLEDLDDPLLLTEYYSDTQATDHNLYIRGNRLYMTNNRAGLRVLDITEPENPVEVGHFDTTPWSNDAAGFDGTWSVYPYFESGTVVISSRREGLFIVKPRVRPLIG